MGDQGQQATQETHRGNSAHLQEPFDPTSYKWGWRRKLAANPVTNQTYRIVIGVIGLVIVALGLLAIPLPGPGWLIVFLGLGVWATEFLWAARLLAFAKAKVAAWNDWLRPKPLWVKGLVALATCAFVLLVLWTTLKVGGVPGFLPDAAKDFLHQMPGLG